MVVVFDEEYHFPFNAPLNKDDTETQTFGCRCKNPDACKHCGCGFCAFVRSDHICKRPSSAWKKQYHKLKGDANDNK